MYKYFLKILLCLSLVTVASTSYSADKSCSSLFESKKSRYIKLAVAIPLSIAVSSFIWKTVDENYFWPKAEANVTSQIISKTETQKNYLDDLIENDFRFRRIKEADLDMDVIKMDSRLNSLQTQKRMAAFIHARNYTTYYVQIYKIKAPLHLTLEQNREQFGAHPLFQHLNFFFDNGVQKYEGTRVEDKYLGPLSDAQQNRLFSLTHELYLQYALIDLAYKKQDPSAATNSDLIKTLSADPYTQKLQSFKDSGKISPDKFVYYLQEDAYNNYYIEMFNVMHIVNLKSTGQINAPKSYTADAITLNDLRESRIKTITEADEKK